MAYIQDLNKLEGLTSIVALFAKHANSTEYAGVIIEEDKLELLFDRMHEVLTNPSAFTKDDYAASKRSRDDTLTHRSLNSRCLAPEDAQKQSFWLAGSTSALQLLQSLFGLNIVLSFACSELEREAKMIITLSKYSVSSLSSDDWHEQQVDPWITPLSSKIAHEMLSHLASRLHNEPDTVMRQHRIRLSKHILLSYIKPLFTNTPHPMLNPETGRKLDRRRGGDLFGDSWMDGDWKGQSVSAEEMGAIGCWKTYLYVLSIIEVSFPTKKHRINTSLMSDSTCHRRMILRKSGRYSFRL